MKKNKVKVCHITTVHPLFDVRIFHKECVSLTKYGFDLSLIVRHSQDEIINGVKIIALKSPKPSGLWRLYNCWQALRKALSLRADVYHFHDPELMLGGIALKLFTSAKVIYDVHEDIKKHALGKMWIKSFVRPLLAQCLRNLERLGEYFYNTIIIAEDSYKDNFRKLPVIIHNYPIISDLELQVPKKASNSNDNKSLVYVGILRQKRGVYEMIEAMSLLNKQYPHLQLYLVGQFFPASLEEKVRLKLVDLGLEKNIIITGRQPYEQVWDYINKSDIGLAILHPDGNYINSLPTKMFEYMLMKKPVVVSDFPLWAKIVDDANCGRTVDPLDSKQIALTLSSMLSDPELCKKLGENGRQAVLTKYNWDFEEKKLLSCYHNLIQS